jgi:hypothetical protein
MVGVEGKVMARFLLEGNSFETQRSCTQCLPLSGFMYVCREGINTLSGKETVPLDPPHVSLFR